jgi:hypothetical protein
MGLLGRQRPPFTPVSRAVKKTDISGPLDFVHEVHVGFDPETGEFSVSAAWVPSAFSTQKKYFVDA